MPDRKHKLAFNEVRDPFVALKPLLVTLSLPRFRSRSTSREFPRLPVLALGERVLPGVGGLPLPIMHVTLFLCRCPSRAWASQY